MTWGDRVFLEGADALVGPGALEGTGRSGESGCPQGARVFLRGPGCSGVWMPWRKTWCSGGLDALKEVVVPWVDGLLWGS